MAVNRPALDIPLIIAVKSVTMPLLTIFINLPVKSSIILPNQLYKVGKHTAIASALKIL